VPPLTIQAASSWPVVSWARISFQSASRPGRRAACGRATAAGGWQDLPVPDRPATARFSARITRSSVVRASWVAAEMEDSLGRQVENVLPEGNLTALRRPSVPTLLYPSAARQMRVLARLRGSVLGNAFNRR
jgi:hypothetical protein